MLKKIICLALISFMLMGATPQEEIISNTLRFEGVKMYNNSKRGIELSTLKTYNKLKGTNWELESLTHNQAVEILKVLYWSDRLNYITSDWVKWAVFDFQMNTSSSKAYKLMHKAFGLNPQSTLSLELVAELNSLSPKYVVNRICDIRLEYLRSLSSWNKQSVGWSKRVEQIRELGGLK